MKKPPFIIPIIFTLLCCKENKKSNHTEKMYEPIANSVQFDLKESDTTIALKWIQSDEILYNYFYKMYKDDSLIKLIKKAQNERLEYERKYAIREPFVKWLKKQAINLEKDKVFISEKHFEGEVYYITYYIEIEYPNNSSYYVFENKFSDPIFKMYNGKKGYIKNLFDTLVEYENIKIEKEKPLHRIITGDIPWVVSKFEKNYVTTARNLQFSNKRYTQLAYLSSRLDSVTYRQQTGMDLDSIKYLQKREMDSLELRIQNHQNIY